jgi:acetate kinase
MAASLGGIDALVFTGGVGENQASLREQTCAALGFLGVALGAGEIAVDGPDLRLSTVGSAVNVLVIHARDDREMARQARSFLRTG